MPNPIAVPNILRRRLLHAQVNNYCDAGNIKQSLAKGLFYFIIYHTYCLLSPSGKFIVEMFWTYAYQGIKLLLG